MLQINIASKQELLDAIQKAPIKKVEAQEIHNTSDLNEFINQLRRMMSSNKKLTAIAILE